MPASSIPTRPSIFEASGFVKATLQNSAESHTAEEYNPPSPVTEVQSVPLVSAPHLSSSLPGSAVSSSPVGGNIPASVDQKEPDHTPEQDDSPLFPSTLGTPVAHKVDATNLSVPSTAPQLPTIGSSSVSPSPVSTETDAKMGDAVNVPSSPRQGESMDIDYDSRAVPTVRSSPVVRPSSREEVSMDLDDYLTRDFEKEADIDVDDEEGANVAQELDDHDHDSLFDGSLSDGMDLDKEVDPSQDVDDLDSLFGGSVSDRGMDIDEEVVIPPQEIDDDLDSLFGGPLSDNGDMDLDKEVVPPQDDDDDIDSLFGGPMSDRGMDLDEEVVIPPQGINMEQQGQVEEEDSVDLDSLFGDLYSSDGEEEDDDEIDPSLPVSRSLPARGPYSGINTRVVDRVGQVQGTSHMSSPARSMASSLNKEQMGSEPDKFPAGSSPAPYNPHWGDNRHTFVNYPQVPDDFEKGLARDSEGRGVGSVGHSPYGNIRGHGVTTTSAVNNTTPVRGGDKSGSGQGTSIDHDMSVESDHDNDSDDDDDKHVAADVDMDRDNINDVVATPSRLSSAVAGTNISTPVNYRVRDYAPRPIMSPAEAGLLSPLVPDRRFIVRNEPTRPQCNILSLAEGYHEDQRLAKMPRRKEVGPNLDGGERELRVDSPEEGVVSKLTWIKRGSPVFDEQRFHNLMFLVDVKAKANEQDMRTLEYLIEQRHQHDIEATAAARKAKIEAMNAESVAKAQRMAEMRKKKPQPSSMFVQKKPNKKGPPGGGASASTSARTS
ncbi:hypothetical protein GGS20DRAFT_598171 [Poronia punctata]|nr:hypothetical protein GGS20DRAFT_598171 [Poronia punctata]